MRAFLFFYEHMTNESELGRPSVALWHRLASGSVVEAWMLLVEVALAFPASDEQHACLLPKKIIRLYRLGTHGNISRHDRLSRATPMMFEPYACHALEKTNRSRSHDFGELAAEAMWGQSGILSVGREIVAQ
jgi:hypothetical protein